MIRTWVKPPMSSVSRIAPTRPSIISDGAMTSQPALAWTSDWRQSMSTVSSLATAPSRTTPSWPWAVNGSSAASHSTPSPGWARLTAVTARHTRLSGLTASSPSGLLSSAGTTGKMAITGIPRDAARPASSISDGIVWRQTPGIEGIASRPDGPSWTKTGQMKSAAVRTVSETKRRDQSSRRLRRSRTRGYAPREAKGFDVKSTPRLGQNPDPAAIIGGGGAGYNRRRSNAATHSQRIGSHQDHIDGQAIRCKRQHQLRDHPRALLHAAPPLDHHRAAREAGFGIFAAHDVARLRRQRRGQLSRQITVVVGGKYAAIEAVAEFARVIENIDQHQVAEPVAEFEYIEVQPRRHQPAITLGVPQIEKPLQERVLNLQRGVFSDRWHRRDHNAAAATCLAESRRPSRSCVVGTRGSGYHRPSRVCACSTARPGDHARQQPKRHRRDFARAARRPRCCHLEPAEGAQRPDAGHVPPTRSAARRLGNRPGDSCGADPRRRRARLLRRWRCARGLRGGAGQERRVD